MTLATNCILFSLPLRLRQAYVGATLTIVYGYGRKITACPILQRDQMHIQYFDNEPVASKKLISIQWRSGRTPT